MTTNQTPERPTNIMEAIAMAFKETINQTPDSALDDATHEIAAAIDTAMGGDGCLCHDTPADNCLDIDHVVREQLEARYKAGVTAGRREALKEVLRGGGSDAVIANRAVALLNAALATPTETKPTEAR